MISNDHPRLRWAWLVGVLVSLPSLGVGFNGDDFVHRALYADAVDGIERTPFGLYDFSGTDSTPELIEEGRLPWWTDEQFSLRFFRPVSSATLALDIELFGDSSFWAHTHSLLWLALLLWLASRIFRMVLPSQSAGVASLIYGLSNAHSLSLGSISARHVLVASVFGAFAILLHLRSARTESRQPGVLSLAALAVSCCAGEGAIAAVAFIFAFELLRSEVPRSKRFWRFAPVGALFLVYISLYHFGGYGVRASGLYIDPLSNTSDYLAALPGRLLTLSAAALTTAPAALMMLGSGPALVMQACGLLAVLATIGILWGLRGSLAEREWSALRWLLLGAGAALLVGAAGMPGDRLLSLPALGSSALLAVCVVRLRQWARERDRRTRVGARTLAAAVLVGHVGVACLLRLGTFVICEWSSETTRLAATDSNVHCTEEMVLVNGADARALAYAPAAAWAYDVPFATHVYALTAAPQELVVRRLDSDALEIELVGPRQRTLAEALVTPDPPSPGDVVEVEGIYRVKVIAPETLRFDFRKPLDEVCLVQWKSSRFQELSLPEPGAEVALPFEFP